MSISEFRYVLINDTISKENKVVINIYIYIGAMKRESLIYFFVSTL